MVMKKIVGTILAIVMFLSVIGCDQNPAITPSADQFPVSPFRQVHLSDFDPLGEAYAYPDLGDDPEFEDLLMPELSALLDVSLQLGMIIMDTMTPARSISAALYFSIRDEVAQRDYDDATILGEIEYLDIFLGGGLNSLASLSALIREDEEFDFPVDLLEADGTMKASFFIKGSVMDEDNGPSYAIAESGYIELNVDIATDLDQEEVGVFEGTVSGELHLSVGTTIVPSIVPDDDEDFYQYHLIYVIDVEPFSVDLADIDEFMELMESEDYSPEDDFWAAFAELLWGDAEAEGVVVTRIVGGADGNQVSSDRLTGADIFEILLALLAD